MIIYAQALKRLNAINIIIQFMHAENTEEEGEWELAEYAEMEENDGDYVFKEEWLATYRCLEAQPLQAEDFPSPVYVRQLYKRKRPN